MIGPGSIPGQTYVWCCEVAFSVTLRSEGMSCTRISGPDKASERTPIKSV
jgi:hypothetical protein